MAVVLHGSHGPARSSFASPACGRGRHRPVREGFSGWRSPRARPHPSPLPQGGRGEKIAPGQVPRDRLAFRPAAVCRATHVLPERRIPRHHLRRSRPFRSVARHARRSRLRDALADPGRDDPAAARRPRPARPGADRHRQDRRVRAADPRAPRSREDQAAGAGARADARARDPGRRGVPALRRRSCPASTCCRSTAARATARSSAG